MSKKKCTAKNITQVLANLDQMANSNASDAKILAKHLNEMLDELRAMDFFGTEGQCDPRGDERD